MLPCLALYTGPQAYQASTVPAEPALQPCTCIFITAWGREGMRLCYTLFKVTCLHRDVHTILDMSRKRWLTKVKGWEEVWPHCASVETEKLFLNAVLDMGISTKLEMAKRKPTEKMRRFNKPAKTTVYFSKQRNIEGSIIYLSKAYIYPWGHTSIAYASCILRQSLQQNVANNLRHSLPSSTVLCIITIS